MSKVLVIGAARSGCAVSKLLKKHGYDVLILNENVDEFLINILMDYDGKKFKSISQGDLDLLDEAEKDAYLEKLLDQNKAAAKCLGADTL